jgi:hypothetical protein
MPENDTIQVGQVPVGVQQASSPAPPPPAPPARPPARRPKLDHAAMVAVIRAGGSVIHGGQVIAHEHLLPTEEELARGDADREADAAAALDAQIAALTARRARLAAAAAPASKPAEAKADDRAAPTKK